MAHVEMQCGTSSALPTAPRALTAFDFGSNADPKDHINIRILQNMISGIPLHCALEPECEIFMFMWSAEP